MLYKYKGTDTGLRRVQIWRQHTGMHTAPAAAHRPYYVYLCTRKASTFVLVAYTLTPDTPETGVSPTAAAMQRRPVSVPLY